MNILHFQFDTEIRTLYQIRAMKNNNNFYLLFSGKSYNEQFGYGNEIFSKTFHINNIRLPNIFYLNHSKEVQSVVNFLKVLIKDNKIDLIHVHKRTDIQCYIALKTGIPVVIDSHDLICIMESSLFGKEGPKIFRIPIIGKLLGNSFYNTLEKVEKYSFQNADSIIAVSPIMKDQISTAYDINPNKINVLVNTVPLDYCVSKPKAQYNFPIKAILATSFFIHKDSRSHRNILNLINILKNLNTLDVDIYGNTTGVSLEEIEQFFSNYSNIHYKGFLDPKKFEKIVDNYDIGIVYNNPHYDVNIGKMSLPKKFFEYAAKGLPILSNESEQVVDFIKTYKIGSVFNEASEKSILEAIQNIMDNYQLYSNNALNLVKDTYNWDEQDKKLQMIYTNVKKNPYDR